MQSSSSFWDVLRGIAFFAVLGFLVTILIGPIIAIISALFAIGIAFLSILLPLVILGLLVWVPYRLIQGRPIPWQQMAERAKGAANFLVVKPLQLGQNLWAGTVRFTRSAAEWVTYYGGVGMEMIAGGLLGALIVAVIRWDHSDHIEEWGLGALIGMVVGAVVGLANRRSAQVSPSRNDQ